MMQNFFPKVANDDELSVVDSLIESLRYLQKEALKDGQNFIAYAIDDAILEAQKVREETFLLASPQNKQ